MTTLASISELIKVPTPAVLELPLSSINTKITGDSCYTNRFSRFIISTTSQPLKLVKKDDDVEEGFEEDEDEFDEDDIDDEDEDFEDDDDFDDEMEDEDVSYFIDDETIEDNQNDDEYFYGEYDE